MAWGTVHVLAWCFWSLCLTIVFATVATFWAYMIVVHWKIFPELLK